MSDETEKSTVRVTIFGEEYAIRTDMGEEYTLSCAAHVDDAVQQAHVKGQVAESHRAAVLAALQITDELYRNRKSLAAQSDLVVERLSALRNSVEKAVGGA
jgi:cell division protein ZapA